MVDTPKLGKRVKKEAVSEEDKERDQCRRDGIYSSRNTERIETIGEGRALMKKCQRAIKYYKEEERVREIDSGIESQIRNDSRRLWQWIGRQLYGEKSRKAMMIKKGSNKW